MENLIISYTNLTSGIDNLLMSFAREGDEVFHGVAELLAKSLTEAINEDTNANLN